MSIKKLFESTNTSRNYLSDTSEKKAFEDVESAKNVSAISTQQERFVPQVNYSQPRNFAKYGSARLYYNSAINRVLDYFPYDGSEYEITDFHNKSLDIENYIFEKEYPRSTGYAKLCASSTGWGTRLGNLSGGYGTPGTAGGAYDYEYIEFSGGPHTVTSSTAAALFPDITTAKRNYANVYDTDIYTTAGLEANYGSGSRESNLKCDFDTGVTVEFWMKKDAFVGGSKTNKEVIFDIWNGEENDGTGGTTGYRYGRITLVAAAAGFDPPLLLTVRSGSTGWREQKIGSNDIDTSTIADGNWKHYALSLQNSGSQLVAKLYVTGAIDSTTVGSFGTLGSLASKASLTGAMGGRLGALIAPASGKTTSRAGQGKLSASIDEFRFWKVARTPKEIGENWFTQVRGGTNTDISNATLGLYYKFNAGITADAAVDNNVLDYSGRISNGNWIGYSTYSRNTGSAIISASAATQEYEDPIIRSSNPRVITLKDTLLSKGAEHDYSNNSAFKSLIPSWVVEAQDSILPNESVATYDNNIEIVSHIVGTYFDKLRLQIKALPTFKHLSYTSASQSPFPFAQHLPQSLGLYMPEVFIDANVLERFRNRTSTMLFDGDLNETKNLIYLNLYNNLTNIFKSKGTEKAIRNVYRCFNLDDSVVRLNIYAQNEVYELKDNLKQSLVTKKTLNLNGDSLKQGVVYQAADGTNAESLGYISGSNGAGLVTGSSILGYEFPYGFTAEADVIFPVVGRNATAFNRQYKEVSLYGMCTADTGSAASLNGTATTWVSNYTTEGRQPDFANFQVMAVKENNGSTNAYFKLSSSNFPYLIPELTSSMFYDVYDDSRWNISVRLKPTDFGTTNIVSGSITNAYTYDLVFQGINTVLGTVQNSFTLTASLSQNDGHNFLKSAKRLSAGALRTNITGASVAPCDVLFNGVKYWAKYVDDLSLYQHAYDLDNSGISGSYRHISPLDLNLKNSGSVLNSNMLALDWRFNNLSSSDANGSFFVEDHSSGSAQLRNNYGWVGNLAGYQHVGSGSGWPATSQDIIHSQSVNAFRFVNPEYAVSSDMVNIMSNDDVYFGIFESPPSYKYTLEKSMYNAISEEILDFFAGVVDFNNVIGEPVNRYRGRYKALEKLREIFFRRVSVSSDNLSGTGVTQVEKFIEYYKWFDDAIALVIGQLLPASVDFTADSYNTIESHVLERNKYQSKYPIIKDQTTDPEASAFGSYAYAPSPPAESPRPTNVSADFWKYQADRTSAEITSNDATIDYQRNIYRVAVGSEPTYPSTLPLLTDAKGNQYYRPQGTTRGNSFATITGDALNTSTKNRSGSVIHGGVNFDGNKSIGFTYNALYPAGPVNQDDGKYVPENTLFANIDDLLPLNEIEANIANFLPNRKLKRVFSKVQHGRNWENGFGYSNTKSTFAFPFNIMSASVESGYNRRVATRLSSTLEVVNLHNDVYGDDWEVPMQGTFTSYHVGGHQSRHVPLNTGSALDTYLTRPEAWKLLLGKCPDTSGAIGMVGPDYPWPEANEAGVFPYPMTGAQKAVYYRGYTAKRPVNIRNISQSYGMVLGNYSQNYQIISTVGAYTNPQQFIKKQPSLPTEITQTPSASQGRSYMDIHRQEESHFQFVPNYSLAYLRSADDPPCKSVIISRFAAPGDIQSMGLGYMDIRSGEYSVYNSLPYRNWSVIRPFQASSSISEATGTGTAGIRSYDQLGKDYGLRILLARHSGRFGRDSRFELNPPGQTYAQLPSFQKVNRNRLILIDSSSSGYSSGSNFDNAFVTHAIPRAVRQYSWLSSSILSASDMRYNRYQPTAESAAPWQLGFFSGTAGHVHYFTFVSGTNIETSAGIYQPTTRLNILTIDPVTASTSNTIGLPLGSSTTNYFNNALLDALPAADATLVRGNTANYFNLLMTRRGATFGWNWQKLHQNHNPINNKEISGANISLTKTPPGTALTSYRLTPLSTKGRLAKINITAPKSSEVTTPTSLDNSFTIQVSDNNKRIGTSNTALDNYLAIPWASIVTPYDHVLGVAADPKYTINWLLYTEGVFPSDYNEFYQTTIFRTGYDNKFWRDARTARNTVGATFRNSFSMSVSQSAWILDAQTNFLTRTKATLPSPSWDTGSATDIGLEVSGAAGELQNNYFFYFDTKGSTGGPLENKFEAMRPAGLYARKHMLTTPKSASPWNNIAEIPTAQWKKQEFNSSSVTLAPEPYAGEALWEANTQAGTVVKSAGIAAFQSRASQPWFNKYGDYQYDLKLIAKNYSILPEFRISDHVEDYTTYGIDNESITDTFSIPGTSLDSSQSSFYKDYSNSEFMKEFVNIPAETNLSASQIRLVMSAAIRFNPYKGFYPAQRALDLVSQFSRSFGNGIIGKAASDVPTRTQLFAKSGSLFRPLAAPLFAPGILFNSLKGGVAMDYPILTDGKKFLSYAWTGSSNTTDNWALTAINRNTNSDVEGYSGGEWWDQRLPFETIIEPEKYINGLLFVDNEAHPSCSMNVTASWSGEADTNYSKMASNFFGEIPNFFLTNNEFTTLKSGPLTDDLKFEEGKIYGARIILQRSVDGQRNYNFESGAAGTSVGWGKNGFVAWSGSAAAGRSLGFSQCPVPQDPIMNPSFKPLFMPYSRPTAFGPPVAGRPEWGASGVGASMAQQGSSYGVQDSFTGRNPAFTPPYTDGEAWCDLIFAPIAGETYSLERIMSETSGVYWRFDPGPERYTANLTKYQNIPACATGAQDPGPPYGGGNINHNVAHLSSSFNIFGIENIFEQTTDKFGNLIDNRNKIAAKRWVIQSKFETPMMNFTDADPIHPITNANGTLTLPVYGSSSVPRGMWHQFGVPPSAPNMGIFLSIGDIDSTNWLKYHYDVINNDSIYNRGHAAKYGRTAYSDIGSLSKLLGFDKETSKKRMGELANKQTIKEAVVAVPYIIERVDSTTTTNTDLSYQRKKFINIPKDRFEAALPEAKGSTKGDSLETAGASIRRLLQKMDRYVLPPMFDFKNNRDIKPVVMYIFEFEYELDKNDLAYIWQNLAPRNYKKFQLENTSVAHELLDTELLDADIIHNNENLRWMLFKVKQRGMSSYFEKITSLAGESAPIPDTAAGTSAEYPVDYNWPYDYVSIVEMAKMDVQVLYQTNRGMTSYDDGHAHTYMADNEGNGKTSENDDHFHDIIDGIVQKADGHIHSLENQNKE